MSRFFHLTQRPRCRRIGSGKFAAFVGRCGIAIPREHARMDAVPMCRIITIHTFRGDRTTAFTQRLFGALDDQRNRRGPGPSRIDCLLFAGHTGLSTDKDRTIYGFNPNGGTDPIWLVIQRLRNGDAYPGVVRDDTAVFTAAQRHGLTVLRFDIALSPPSFQILRRRLAAERKHSKYSYGFPDGDGDCNCTTWIERLGLPLLTGRMDEFTAVTSVVTQMRRRFGLCR
jgi:hypothetical protein